MAINKEYARLRDEGFLDKARQFRAANRRIRILSKSCGFSGKRGAVYSLLRDGMKVEDWLADCGQVFNGTHLNPTYLLALYIGAKVIEPV